MTEFRKKQNYSKHFKKSFHILNVSDDTGLDILMAFWKNVFLVTLYHKVIESNKIQPDEQISKISSMSHPVELFDLKGKVNLVVNTIP